MGKFKLSAKKVAVLLAVICCFLAIYAIAKTPENSAANLQLQAENKSYAASIQELNEILSAQEEKIQQIAPLEKKVNDLQYELKLKLSDINDLQYELKLKLADINDLQYELKLRQATIDKLQAPAKQTSASAQSSVTTSTQKSQTVYVTNTGSKYHRSGCQYLSKSQISISLNDAKSQGYSACSKCF